MAGIEQPNNSPSRSHGPKHSRSVGAGVLVLGRSTALPYEYPTAIDNQLRAASAKFRSWIPPWAWD